MYLEDGTLTVRYSIEEDRGYGIEAKIVTETIELEPQILSAIKTLIMDREKQVGNNSGGMTAKEAIHKDKVLKRLNKLQWWTWKRKPQEEKK